MDNTKLIERLRARYERAAGTDPMLAQAADALEAVEAELTRRETVIPEGWSFEDYCWNQWKSAERRVKALEVQAETAGNDPEDAPLWRRIAEQRKALAGLNMAVRVRDNLLAKHGRCAAAPVSLEAVKAEELSGQIVTLAFEDGVTTFECNLEGCECPEHDTGPAKAGTYVTVRLDSDARIGLSRVRLITEGDNRV